ncbi:hypothetical protein F9Z77_18375, partial [Escherichia coli]
FMDSVHHIWCPLFSQEFQDLPDGAETTLTVFWLWLLIWRSNAWRGERTLSLLALTRCSTAMPWINDWRCLNQAKMGHA